MTWLTNVDARTNLLVGKLDPDRDYGDLGYGGVLLGLEAGEITIADSGRDQPLLSDARTGKRIKGSGVPAGFGGATSPPEWSRTRFNERAAEDFDAVYEALVAACVVKHDPRAMKLFIETHIGAPRQAQLSGYGELMEKLLDRLAEPRERVIEVRQ